MSLLRSGRSIVRTLIVSEFMTLDGVVVTEVVGQCADHLRVRLADDQSGDRVVAGPPPDSSGGT